MSDPSERLDEDLRLVHDAAQVSLWWTHGPTLPSERLGVLGAFAATSGDAARAILTEAIGVLRARGCTLAVGPMNGNTWRHYRFVTDPGDEPPFFLEPTNPEEWPRWWRDAGFAPLAEYYSSATNDLSRRDERVEHVAARFTSAGIVLRSIDPTAFESELRRIYAVSTISFQGNFLYTPIEEDAFLAQYRPIQSRVQPDLVLLAEQAGRCVGYVFAIPDLAQAQRGERISTVIVKTLAVLPGRAYAGLGAWLLAELHATAARLGFTRAIHALMHQTNRSRNLSAHYARTIRRYTLLARRLT